MIVLFLILLAVVAWLGSLQADYNNDSPAGRAAKAEKLRKKAARKRYRNIEAEAYRKYPGIGGQFLKREAYIERRLRGENPD